MSRRVASFIAASSIAVMLSACSSGGGATADSSSGPPLTGDPVKIVAIDDASDTLPFKDVDVAVEAIVKAVNSSGGVKGRPLDYTICSTKGGDQNTGAKCAREAAADPTVVAIVGQWSQTGTMVNPVLDEAGMANIGLFPQAASDYTAESAFPISSGTAGVVGGMVTLAADQLHAKKIGLAYTASPQGAAVQQILAPVAAAHGAELTATTAIPAGAADVSSNVQATANGIDAVALSSRGQDSVKYIQSAFQQGIKTPIVAPANFEAALIKQLPDQGEGLYFSDNFLRQGPGYDAYVAAVSAVDESQVSSLRTINTWVAAQAFLAAAEKAPTLDRAGILTGMKSLDNFTLEGLIPALDFSKPATTNDGKFPRLFNNTVTYNTMAKGVLVPIDTQFRTVFGSAG